MKKAIKRITYIFLFISSSAFAQNVQEIVKKAIHASYYQGKDAKATVDMKIIDKQGRERTRNITLLRKNMDDKDGNQKYYAYFNKPADVKKMVFMAWKNVKGSDDRWLYLRSLDLVKRIAASDDRTSFVGSHFFYEDVSGRNITEDVHSLISQDDKYYVIKSVPKNSKTTEFAYMKNWIDKKTFIPMKAEYYKTNEKIYREYSVKKVEVINGFSTVIDAEMKDNLTGGKTVLHYSFIKYNIGLPDNIFSERYLRRPPFKYLLK
jgi:Outer membrane lipoprotein-sorting protein